VGFAICFVDDHGVMAYASRRGLVTIAFDNDVCDHVLEALKSWHGLPQELFGSLQVPALASQCLFTFLWMPAVHRLIVNLLLY
jgi:hypothetical protein